MQPYSAGFFAALQEGSKRSAQVIVPLIVELFRPESVIDLGCGVGAWLGVFQQHGITDIVGVDGGHIDRTLLEIKEEQFLAADLRVPLRLNRRFDLAVCLEVAEHLPPENAEVLIGSLATLAPVVIFSAAIPFQGGISHLNEQWPGYWEEQFERVGYAAIDCVRRHIWRNESVDWWYAQNLLCFVDREAVRRYPRLDREPTGAVLALVHPKNYMEKVHAGDPGNLPVRSVLSLLPGMLGRALRGRIGRRRGNRP